MAVAQGSCPNCGAPIEFGMGSSISKVCEYCTHTILRNDHGFENLGQVARLANTPSLIAVGDEGSLDGRFFQVAGRVQLDHGKGPWDEYYVVFDHGAEWGWLAYAQGHWYVTSLVHGIAAPPYNSLSLEMDVALGQLGVFRVAERKQGTITSAEGELPGVLRTGTVRFYADLSGPQGRFATLDYGDNSGGYSVFAGWVFSESQLRVTQLGPRSVQTVKTTSLKCPNCGGDIPKLSGERAERVGCPYCGALSDITEQKIIAQQEAAQRMPDIPVSAKGNFDGTEYVCAAYVRRGTSFDGERYTWEEYLLWADQVGFRWLVKDPEQGWSWISPVNLADIDLRSAPNQIAWGGRSFQLRNTGQATVEYVLGEVYWKCEVGETTGTADYVSGQEVLSREHNASEVRYSHGAPVAWSTLATAFALPIDGPGARFGHGSHSSGSTRSFGAGLSGTVVTLVIIVFVLIMCAQSGGFFVLPSRGGGVYYGGK